MKKTFLILAAMLCCIMLNAQQPAGDGSQANPYQIATVDDLVWFANHVNSGNTTACAILTTDITMNNNVLDTDGRPNDGPFTAWTPIGKPGTDFEGEFNGNGHTISGLYFYNTEENDVGVFGKAINDAYIHDLGVRDSYFYGKDHVGGICGDFANGLIENCWSEVAVYVTSGDGGGLTGSVYINSVLKNSYSICSVEGNGSRGLVCGAFYGTIENCYAKQINSAGTTNAIGWTSGEGPHTATNVEVKDAAAFASGEVCWLLNSGVTDGTQKWYQTLDTDNFPVLNNSHGTVYRGYDGDVLTYSNSLQSLSSIDNVAYIDANGETQTHDNVSIINNASEQVTWSAGWYVVQGADITLAKGAVCNGAVHLILADGAKLTATGNNDLYTPGIQVSGEGNSLTIYGQTAQSGQLIATGGTNAAGIGGGKYGSGSNITINGCKVTANGGDCGAGIGGGQHGSGSNITIKGGTVTATGGKSAAGIGGGDDGSGSNITINGGVVTATGGSEAAGIGGGCGGYGPYIIIITGGTVTATGGDSGSGIGCGSPNSSPNIFVATELTVVADNNNPPTTVIAHTTTTDIASDLNGKRYAFVGTPQGGIVTYGDYITVSPVFTSGDHIAACTQVTFTADDRWTDNHEFIGFYKESTFNTPITVGVSGRVYTTTVVHSDLSVYAKYEPFTPIPYIDADGQQKSVKAAEITTETNTLRAGWYVVTGEVSRGNITCNGAVHLILTDGVKLTATGGESQAGITVSGDGNSLTIYGQTAQSGQLIAKGGKHAAGIGGEYTHGSNITINGGEITAIGGDCGTGIGGGDRGAGYNIIINRGVVTATGGGSAAGIGGGFEESGYDITINGGEVTANGGKDGAGIGGGVRKDGYNITINGGIITATGGDCGTGIGGGFEASGYNITINGGEVTANGGKDGAGIGGGAEGSGSNIKMATALTVYAGNTNPPIIEISHTDDDIAPYIVALRYLIVKDEMTNVKNEAIAAINAAIIGVTNADIIAIATYAIDAINAAANPHEIEIIKAQALAAIASAKAILGDMGVPCDDCPAVEVTKGTKTVKLYNPESVKFKKE